MENAGAVRLDVKKIIGEGSDAAVFFELETKVPAKATVWVAEWHQVRDGKVFHAQSAFDGRPYAALFPGNRTKAAAKIPPAVSQTSIHAHTSTPIVVTESLPDLCAALNEVSAATDASRIFY